MKKPLSIAFFGSSLVSAYWNGAATYYRGILRNLAARGHRITFYEPDAFDRQLHRDIPDPDWAEVVVYSPDSPAAVRALVHGTRGVDLLIKASGVGVHDELLEKAVLEMQSPRTRVIFWDVDAPATLERVHGDPADPFRALIPEYDMILTYGGGQPVIASYTSLGARRCVPIYNALDPQSHFPVAPKPLFTAELGFLGNRLPDREARTDEFFFNVANSLPMLDFLLAGSGWRDKPMACNIDYFGHLGSNDHNAFNSSAKAVLNISRESMARFGFSPATRVFEAAGAAACIITDAWDGIELFLEPGSEVLIANNGSEVAQHLESLSPQRAMAIGRAALQRVLSQHTYLHRVIQLEDVLAERSLPNLLTPAR
jgi:spore maturation protein CgeB